MPPKVRSHRRRRDRALGRIREGAPSSLDPDGAPGKPRFWGISLASHLRERGVSERMAESCQGVLALHGLQAEFRVLYDDRAPQPGAALALFAEAEDGWRMGADQTGAPGRPAEAIGKAVARMLL